MPDPLVLGLDTSAAHCAAALLSGERLRAGRFEPMARGQAERLFPMIEEMLAEAGAAWRDLSAIGVGTGPGNFTGIRLGVAAARGLALALGIPAVGVSVTEAMAFGLPRPCRVLVPARGGEVVWQDFGPADDTCGLRQAPAGAVPPGPAPAEPRVPLAEAVARIALARRGDPGPRPAPIYLRPADAAPARETGPVMLP